MKYDGQEVDEPSCKLSAFETCDLFAWLEYLTNSVDFGFIAENIHLLISVKSSIMKHECHFGYKFPSVLNLRPFNKLMTSMWNLPIYVILKENKMFKQEKYLAHYKIRICVKVRQNYFFYKLLYRNRVSLKWQLKPNKLTLLWLKLSSKTQRTRFTIIIMIQFSTRIAQAKEVAYYRGRGACK